MNASDFASPTDQVTDVPDTQASGITEPSAAELFAQAWGGATENADPETPETTETPPSESDQEEPSTTDLPSPDASSTAPEPRTAPPELTQEYIDAQVQARIADAQRQQAEEAQRKQVEDALSRMSDTEYGQYMRQYSQQVAAFKSAQEAAMVNFYRESTTDVLQKIPELKQLTPDEAKRINPREASSYSELVSRMADVVAEKRAAKLAEPKAKELFEAWKTNEQAKLAKKAHTIEEMSGRASRFEPDIERTSGKDILQFAFSQNGT